MRKENEELLIFSSVCSKPSRKSFEPSWSEQTVTRETFVNISTLISLISQRLLKIFFLSLMLVSIARSTVRVCSFGTRSRAKLLSVQKELESKEKCEIFLRSYSSPSLLVILVISTDSLIYVIQNNFCRYNWVSSRDYWDRQKPSRQQLI